MINLRRDFENLKMKEVETVKQYLDRIMAVVNQIRLLGNQFPDIQVVEKLITTLPERYESKISSLEDSMDLSTISLLELINALYALEQKRASRDEGHAEGAFQAKNREASCSMKKCKQLDHVKKVCKNKGHTQQQNVEAQTIELEELMFTASYEAQLAAPYELINVVKQKWLIDSRCTSHMTVNTSLFKNVDKRFHSRVKFENDQYIEAIGNRDVLIKTLSGTKLFTDVLLVPGIDQNLLSVGKLLKKNYSVVFKENKCLILDPSGCELISTKMANRSFAVNSNLATSAAYTNSLDETQLWHKK
ncbi:uncharacterized protein [Gossypium hirsutum]|uniref:Retrovirus-related Pol polyprotein from transposon TNT 1-94-like beta-barrel domain-containing protein n=1 Tax=Gossypium hirsutum TaxID=3635 RepID=A0A1U8JQ33_GOSHI|nr:uncharacterized protein LOC107908083 [Gossypium hirsutum]